MRDTFDNEVLDNLCEAIWSITSLFEEVEWADEDLSRDKDGCNTHDYIDMCMQDIRSKVCIYRGTHKFDAGGDWNMQYCMTCYQEKYPILYNRDDITVSEEEYNLAKAEADRHLPTTSGKADPKTPEDHYNAIIEVMGSSLDRYDNLIFSNREDEAKADKIVDLLKELRCKAIGYHKWILDHCSRWEHQYCPYCETYKYPELGQLTCSALDKYNKNKLTEDQYNNKDTKDE